MDTRQRLISAPSRPCPSCADGAVPPEPAVGNYFVSTYPPFSTWSGEELGAVRRAMQTPATVVGGADTPPLGLYVHVPFCVHRCDYCYYLSYAGQSAESMSRYVDAVLSELDRCAGAAALAGRTATFAYFGGGTPSLLPARLIEELLRGVQERFPWPFMEEVSFECAPQSTTAEKMSLLRDLGVTRISLGVQQMDDRVLAANGRVHTVRDVERAYTAIRRAGFDLVNLDLIIGLIGETEESFARGLERIIEMQPESVTLYPLEIPLNTPLYRTLADDTQPLDPPSWHLKRARLGRAFEWLEATGYSVRSAYAAVREPRRHRFVYQDEQYAGADLLGLGAASFSYLAGVHWQNHASLEDYVAAVESGRSPWGRAHELSADERLIREFILQLKLGSAEADTFRAKFGIDIGERFAEPLAAMAEAGFLEQDRGGVTMTRSGLLRVDRLVPAFYLPHHRRVRYS